MLQYMILNFMEGHWQNLFEPVRPDFGVMQDISYIELWQHRATPSKKRKTTVVLQWEKKTEAISGT